MDSHTYLTDLSDAEWQILEPLLPPDARTGRPHIHPLRTLVNAMSVVKKAL
jgi:transposase